MSKYRTDWKTICDHIDEWLYGNYRNKDKNKTRRVKGK